MQVTDPALLVVQAELQCGRAVQLGELETRYRLVAGQTRQHRLNSASDSPEPSSSSGVTQHSSSYTSWTRPVVQGGGSDSSQAGSSVLGDPVSYGNSVLGDPVSSGNSYNRRESSADTSKAITLTDR